MRTISLFRNEKGVALESAILFMTIILTFCFLISSIAVWGYYNIQIENIQTDHYVLREQIGEDYLAYINQLDMQVLSAPNASSGRLTFLTASGDSTEAGDTTKPLTSGSEPVAGGFEAYLFEQRIVYENYSFEEIVTKVADGFMFELTVRQGSDGGGVAVLYIKAVKTTDGRVDLLAWKNFLW